jgi:hypothetical protein
MTIEAGWMLLLWQVFVTVASVVGLVVGMWATLNFAKRKSVEDLALKFTNAVSSQENRLTRIEGELRAAPKHRDLEELKRGMAEVSGRVARLEGTTQQTNHLLQAIHDHLLNDRGKG